MERVTWKLTLLYVQQITNGNLLYDSGNSNQDPVTIQRGGVGRRWEEVSRGRGYVYSYGPMHIDVWQNQCNSVKQLFFSGKKNFFNKKYHTYICNYEKKDTQNAFFRSLQQGHGQGHVPMHQERSSFVYFQRAVGVALVPSAP